jgi:hypothetical protein
MSMSIYKQGTTRRQKRMSRRRIYFIVGVVVFIVICL